jgi:hypothetical protein
MNLTLSKKFIPNQFVYEQKISGHVSTLRKASSESANVNFVNYISGA